ncbi:hypothetical protein SKAU_G00244300 [Synaphobranchus kaupii]|uniref:Spondin domain-containing protein n=1 Tax=Synaphobranchus kaupii TaxID=118154 RepID=A0A9Q1F1V8_SYNKA|nr:hypothetical protein SKAU_G00244300 [Synaphobranchus kaupii]
MLSFTDECTLHQQWPFCTWPGQLSGHLLKSVEEHIHLLLIKLRQTPLSRAKIKGRFRSSRQNNSFTSATNSIFDMLEGTSMPLPVGRANHWSAIIGASHSRDYVLWEYGGYSSEGVKQVAELGSPVKMEEEIRQKITEFAVASRHQSTRSARNRDAQHITSSAEAMIARSLSTSATLPNDNDINYASTTIGVSECSAGLGSWAAESLCAGAHL